MLSQMQLDRFRVEELTVRTNPKLGKSSPNEQYRYKELDFDMAMHRQKKTLFRFRLVADLVPDKKSEQSVYQQIRIVLVGFFSFEEDDPEYIAKMTPYNQIAILYGIARGIVATVSGATGAGMVLLPTVNFVEVIKQKAEREKHSASRLKRAKKDTGNKKANEKQLASAPPDIHTRH